MGSVKDIGQFHIWKYNNKILLLFKICFVLNSIYTEVQEIVWVLQNWKTKDFKRFTFDLL